MLIAHLMSLLSISLSNVNPLKVSKKWNPIVFYVLSLKNYYFPHPNYLSTLLLHPLNFLDSPSRLSMISAELSKTLNCHIQ